jgi:hypothetical protein
MKVARRLIDLFRDSPTYGRDRANLISGFSIGMTALLLNGAVMVLVLPLMLDPDDADFREITEHVEFGQLLAMMLLGGATAFATVLIPLRLVTVFWGPRTGRYFDQIVLSGISPLRFVIGKATSQNLFLGLILFLLLPWLVLSLTLGGVDLSFFAAGLFLVWLYCMALALVTLWASLYLNELLAAGAVICGAVVIAGFGCAPLPIQPFILTPFPVLIHPLYKAMPFFDGRYPQDVLPIFVSCVVGISVVICVSMFAISLGPLYGIIRENSTFGEVVRAGDTKRRRWLRLRPHIQRPSEIAFFYENRSQSFRQHEGGIRWGLGLGGITLLSVGAFLTFVYLVATYVVVPGGPPYRYWVYDFHMTYLWIHSVGVLLAIFLFSHSKNTTYLRIPIIRGREAEVSRMDTTAFLLFLVVSTTGAIMAPFYFERMFALPGGDTIFPEMMYVTEGPRLDYLRIAVEGNVVISIAALVIYSMHRFLCLLSWMRTGAFLGLIGGYFVAVCGIPVFFAMFIMEMHREFDRFDFLAECAPSLAMISPVAVISNLFREMGPRIPRDTSTVPFYVAHAFLLAVIIFGIRRRSRKLREQYLQGPVPEANS